MTKQPRYGPNGPASVFANGSAAQTPPDGRSRAGRGGLCASIGHAASGRSRSVAQGRERFDIFCAPCHGFEGDGDGAIVRRGFPRPPSFYDAALTGAPARLFFDTITDGFGVMYATGSRIPPHDRWAITAYIRALQESRSRKLGRSAGPGDASMNVANSQPASPRRAALSSRRWRRRFSSPEARSCSLPPSPSDGSSASRSGVRCRLARLRWP